MGTNLIPERIKKLIRRVLAVPIGSADVERAFSILSHIRDQRRSKLIPYHLEGLMRIRLNGPKPELFAPLKYAKTWTGILTDDPVNQKKKKTTQSEPKPQENEPSIENEKPNKKGWKMKLNQYGIINLLQKMMMKVKYPPLQMIALNQCHLNLST